MQRYWVQIYIQMFGEQNFDYFINCQIYHDSVVDSQKRNLNKTVLLIILLLLLL